MNKRRMLVLTPTFQGSDGLSAYSRLCIETLAASAESWRLDVQVWTLGDANDAVWQRPPSVSQVRFAAGSKARLLRWGLGAFVDPPAAVFCTHMNVAPAALPAVVRGAKLFVSLLGVEAWRPVRRREAVALRRAHKLIGISQYTVERFRSANPALAAVPAEPCLLCLSEPPSLKPFGTEPPIAQAASERIHSTSRPYALIVSRMSSEERYKGHDELLELWSEVRDSVPNAELWVVGDGDDRRRLEAKAAAADNVANADRPNPSAVQVGGVRFLGKVSDEELKSLYQQCEFFVMPSTGEGFGLVYLEAMRAGKACIGGPGAPAEIIVDGETGRIVDRVDRESLRSVIIQLFKDSGLRHRWGVAGQAREAEQFSVAEFRRRLMERLDFEHWSP